MTAIWLAIVAPVISQTVDTAPAMAMAMAMDCDGHHDHAHPLAPHPSSMEKCGYCGLLSHHPVLLATPLPTTVGPLPAALPQSYRTPFTTECSVLAASPRGPPPLSQQ